MANMPQRPRALELGELAVDAFKLVLGPQLAFYPRPQPEYGIDGDIETFDRNRVATGIHFFVQVKGTDELDLGTALGEAIDMKTANYYRAVTMPVLMVRYHAPTDRIYVRWFHQYDPYFGRGGKKTLTFRWSPDDVWGESTAERIVAEIQAYYAVRGGGMPLPQPLFVRVADGIGVSEVELRIALRNIAGGSARVFDVRSGPHRHGAPLLELRADALVAHVAGTASATMHFPGGVSSTKIEVEQIARDGMVLLALAFERHGQDRASAVLALRYLTDSGMLGEPDVLFALTGTMARSGRQSDAMLLSVEIDDPHDRSASVAAFILSLAPLMADGAVGRQDAKQLEDLLRLRARRRKTSHPREAGATLRNLATFLRRQGRHDKAVEHFRSAAKLDPEIQRDASYWASFAGSLWMIKSYRKAAEAYEQAVKLAPDDAFLGALLGDALLFAGDYARASAAFQRYVDRGAPGDDGEYQIKAFAVPFIVERLGIENQQRRTHRAITVLDVADPKDDASWAAVSVEQLQQDALWGSAWLNLAISERASGNEDAGLLCDVLSTFLIPADIDAWINAINAAMHAEEFALCSALMTVGQRTAGGELTNRFVAQAEALGAPAREAYLSLVDEALEAGGRPRSSVLEEPFPSEDGSFVLPLGFYHHDLTDAVTAAGAGG